MHSLLRDLRKSFGGLNIAWTCFYRQEGLLLSQERSTMHARDRRRTRQGGVTFGLMVEEWHAVVRVLAISLALIVWAGWLNGCSKREKPKTPEEYLQVGNRQLESKNERQARAY